MAEAEVTTVGQMLDRQWDADHAKFNELQEAGRLEVHEGCRKHGVVRGIAADEVNAVVRALDYVYGHKSTWATTRTVGGKKVYDLEYVYQCTGGPAERCSKPWQWCGTSVLFEDWHQREINAATAVRKFWIGQRVSFVWKGQTKYGLVKSVNPQTVSIIVDGERGWFRMPGTEVKAL
ncbi:MAG: hypothetical protein ACOYB2_11140 [Limnohabitans sp.]